MAEQIRTGTDWEDIRVFIALARHGSLSGAARALSVNHATVARRMASLERTLGEKLVERRPNGYLLTAAGDHALVAAKAMETAAAALSRGGAEHTPRGLVRISATPGMTQGFLISRIAGLASRHPGLDIEIATEIRAVSLERHEADIALRFGRPKDGDLIARRAVTFGYGLYGSAEWRRRIKRGTAPIFIGFDEATAHIPDAQWLARRFPRARFALRNGSQFAQAAAAEAGVGIALLPHFIGRANHALAPCLPDHMPPARELWLVTRRQDDKEISIRTVVEFLMRIFDRERRLFEE
jgi:DNA-binding transcriptional LysR family regulator